MASFKALGQNPELLPTDFSHVTDAFNNSVSVAQKAMHENLKSEVSNLADGKVKEKSCPSIMCALAVLSFAQAGLSLADYFKSKNAKDKSECQGVYCPDTNNNGDDNNGGPNNGTPSPWENINTVTDLYNFTPDPNDPFRPRFLKIQDSLKDIKDTHGWEALNDGGVRTPDGNIMSPSQLAEAVSNFSDEERAILQEAAAAGEAAARKVADSDFDGFETGGGKKKRSAGGGYGDGGTGFDMNAYLKSLSGNSKNNRGLAGLSVKMGSDHVGVSEANIFDQISQAYANDKIIDRRP